MDQLRKNDMALLLIRLFFGFAMIYGHGWRKWERLSSGEEITFADPFGVGPGVSLGLAVFAEVFCSALILIGLFTRLATIPLIITMGVAASFIHAGDPFSDKEAAISYLVVYAALLLMGPGWYSLDSWLAQRRRA